MRTIVVGIILLYFGIAAGAQKYTDIKISQLPKATQDYISQNLAGFEITRTVKIEEDGKTSYGVAFESRGRKRVLVFDKDGNFVQKGDQRSTGQREQATDPAVKSPERSAPAETGKSSSSIATSAIPGNAQSYLSSTFPDGKVVSASEFTDKGIVFYQVRVDDSSKSYVVTFNSKGEYLSKRYFTNEATMPKK